MAGLIDFADAVAGDPAYELVALFAGLFRCAPAPLRAFLEAYGPEPAFGPAAAAARTLEAFEAALWAGALEA